MKQKDIIVGLTYIAKVSGKLQPLEVQRIIYDERGKRARTSYVCRNLNTGRQINVKSAARFRARKSEINSL